MNPARLPPADAFTMPRPARHVHLHLVAVDGVIVAPVATAIKGLSFALVYKVELLG